MSLLEKDFGHHPSQSPGQICLPENDVNACETMIDNLWDMGTPNAHTSDLIPLYHKRDGGDYY